MVPIDFTNYFLGSAGAGAALVGLLFVAVSIAPENTVSGGAPLERQAVAASAFTALLNAFFISLGALIPQSNLGWITLIMGVIGLSNSLAVAWTLLRQKPTWVRVLRRAFMIAVGLALYGLELYYAVLLLQSPLQADPVFVLVWLLIGIYGVGLVRAWELLGARRYGLTGWLNPLRDMETTAHPYSAPSTEEKSNANSVLSTTSTKGQSH